jgi:hypothetical protein
METVRLCALHVAARATLTIIGAALLWYGEGLASIFGLILMLIGLICGVSGLMPGDFVPRALDALADRIHEADAHRTAA